MEDGQDILTTNRRIRGVRVQTFEEERREISPVNLPIWGSVQTSKENVSQKEVAIWHKPYR